MTAAEGVKDVRNRKLNLRNLTRLEWLRLLKTVAEFSAENVAAYQLLVTAHRNVRRIGIRIGKVAGIDVDQLHDPIGVCAARGDVQRRLERAGERQVFLQRFGLVNQHVSARGGE